MPFAATPRAFFFFFLLPFSPSLCVPHFFLLVGLVMAKVAPADRAMRPVPRREPAPQGAGVPTGAANLDHETGHCAGPEPGLR